MGLNNDFLDIYRKQSRWRLINEPIAASSHAALKRDSELLKEVACGKRGATARLWEVPQCLVVTRKETRFPFFEQACMELQEQGWPVIVRDSGGTSVPLHPGIINFSIIFPKMGNDDFDLDEIYMALCEPIKRALQRLNLSAEYGETPGSYCDGRYNLNIGGLKITGTAQKIMVSPTNKKGIKQGVLAQAMLMVEADAVAGTYWVNQFYTRAGNNRQFDPLVATSIKHLLPQTQTAEAVGLLTTQVRTLISEEFNLLLCN
jgi:lipoate-protein ligase A